MKRFFEGDVKPSGDLQAPPDNYSSSNKRLPGRLGGTHESTTQGGCGGHSPQFPLPSHSMQRKNVETNRLTHAVLSNDDLDGLSVRDLIHLEGQFNGYLGCIRARKEELLLEQLKEMKEVTKDPMSMNGNLNTVEKSVDSGVSKTLCSQNLESQGDTGSSP